VSGDAVRRPQPVVRGVLCDAVVHDKSAAIERTSVVVYQHLLVDQELHFGWTET
jgi:hypothetical protein